VVLIDAHCHLEHEDGALADAQVERARAAGIVYAIVVGQFHAPGDFGRALAVASRHVGFLSPTMGIHPHDAAKATPADVEWLEQTCARPEVVAVGEAGLDYYYDHSPRDVQRQVFAHQAALAKRLGKPLVVHVRDAHADCLEVLKAEGVTEGVIHCFTGDTDAARGYLDQGFHISLSGIVTYPKTDALQAAVRFAPMERLLVETDSPYLAPVPLRGKKNEPANVVHTARKVAELKGLDAEATALEAARNTARVFRLDVPALRSR
jgi:TatD DNase family protein